jgi:hypothetical protein
VCYGSHENVHFILESDKVTTFRRRFTKGILDFHDWYTSFVHGENTFVWTLLVLFHLREALA